MKLAPVGERALLVELGSAGEVHGTWRALRASPVEGVEEVIAGACTVLVVASPGADMDAVAGAVSALSDVRATPGAAREVVIPVCYGGPDLASVAELCALSEEEVVARHRAASYTVSFLGFSPGFAYLAGGDPRLRVPRLADPRTSVPAGSVAVAGDMTAVYPQATPGGWRIIGRTPAVMFDPDRPEPALLAPGDRVRFEAAETVEAAVSLPPVSPRRVAPPPEASYVEVLDPGPLTTVQDLGRPGWAHAGVPRAGAADRSAAVRANRLVGNSDGAALLESTLSGPRLRVGAAGLVAVCGAAADVLVDGMPARREVALELPAGAELAVAPYRRGARTYVAFSGGGLAVEAVLGSRSTDTLSGLGPAVVGAGERLALHASPGTPRPVIPPPEPGPVVEVTARLGPRVGWVTPAALGTLGSEEFVVEAASDRTGVRLGGPAVPLGRDDQLPSEGLVAGAVEVPPGGRPIVLLRNHPTTGGYPVVAVVDDAGVDALAQARPGDRVRFRLRS